MARTEITVKCNDGTKFKIKFDRKNEYYVLSYRNDLKALDSITGGKLKGAWLYLDSQVNYGDLLAFMFEEISAIDAVEGI